MVEANSLSHINLASSYMRDLDRRNSYTKGHDGEATYMSNDEAIEWIKVRDSARDLGDSGLELEAINNVVVGNLGLVVSLSKKHLVNEHRVHLIDKIAEGNVGLLIAARRFDVTKSSLFGKYATYWIKKHILRETLDLAQIVRQPQNVRTKCKRIYEVINRYRSAHGGNPPLEYISEETGLSYRIVDLLLQGEPYLFQDAFTMNLDIFSEHYSEIPSLGNKPDEILASKEAFERASDGITDEQFEILKLVYVERLPDLETIRRTGMSQPTLYRRKRKALDHIREEVASSKL